MDFETSVIGFNIFVVCMFVWFFYYFHTMISAVLDMNDKLVARINGEQPQEDRMQLRLDKWLEEE